MRNFIFLLSLLLVTAVQGQSIDLQFGENGVTTMPSNNTYCISAFKIKILDNDKIIVPIVKVFCIPTGDGPSTYYHIYRLTQEGDIDATFGNNGSVYYPFMLDIYGGLDLYDMVVQPDGKILACGFASNYNTMLSYLVRFKQDGEVDFDYQMPDAIVENELYTFSPFSIGVLPDGKIIVAALAYDLTSSKKFCLIRFEDNGTIDTEFGENGYIIYDDIPSDYAPKLTVQSDGKIVLLVYQGLVRFNQDGSLDTNFGEDESGNNFSLIPEGGFLYFNDFFIQDDGKFVGFSDIGIARFNSTGDLDTTFNTVGYFTNFTGYIRDAVGFDGKYILSLFVNSADDYIYQLTDAGIVDSTFGNNGKFVNNLLDYSPIAVQSNGKIIATGENKIFRVDPSLVPTADLPENMTDVGIFPNPFTNTATLSFYSPQADDLMLRIFDLYGKLIREYPSLQVSNGHNYFTIEEPDLVNGMYFFNISNGITSQSIKVIVE